MKHTPTPWLLEGIEAVWITGSLAITSRKDIINLKNDANFIHTAVNNHERLLSALKNILPLFDSIEEKDGCLSEDEELYKTDILNAIKQAESD